MSAPPAASAAGAGPVVVGIDFSPPSRRAVALATALCARAGLPLEIVHVWNSGALTGERAVLPAPASWVEARRQALHARGEQWAEEARRTGVAVAVRVLDGWPSEALSRWASELGSTLLVVGRRGAASLGHVLLGSVSERLLHLASCPVLLVPRQSGSLEPPDRLLVGVDFSRASKNAVVVALGMARRFRAEGGVLLVHVRAGEDELWLESWSELAHPDAAPDRAAVERWAGIAEDSPVRVRARVVDGRPEQALLETAEREGCGWLVTAVRGRSPLAALLMGSTTDRIVKLADRPVLVVPAPTAGNA